MEERPPKGIHQPRPRPKNGFLPWQHDRPPQQFFPAYIQQKKREPSSQYPVPPSFERLHGYKGRVQCRLVKEEMQQSDNAAGQKTNGHKASDDPIPVTPGRWAAPEAECPGSLFAPASLSTEEPAGGEYKRTQYTGAGSQEPQHNRLGRRGWRQTRGC